MLYSLIVVLAIVLPPPLLAYISVSVPSNPLVLQYPTYNYFQVNADAYTKENCLLVPLKQQDSSSCTFASAALGSPPNGTCTLAFLNWGDALSAGCRTIAQAIEGVANSFVPQLPSLSLPTDAVLCIMLFPVHGGTPAGPLTTPYISHQSGISNGYPAMNVVMISNEDGYTIANTFHGQTIYASVGDELGAWNGVFISVGYLAFVWLNFSLNAIMVIYTIYHIIMYPYDVVRVDFRTVAFGFGFVASLLSSAGLTLRKATQMYMAIDMTSTVLFALCFTLLIFLWSNVVAQAHKGYFIFLLRLSIVAAMLMQVYAFFSGVAYTGSWPSDSTIYAVEVSHFGVAITQLIMAGFFYWIFYRSLKWRNLRHVDVALSNLSTIITAGFIVFFIKAAINLATQAWTVQTSVAAVTAVFTIWDFTLTIRTFVVLMILKIRFPESQIGVTNFGNSLWSWVKNKGGFGKRDGFHQLDDESGLVYDEYGRGAAVSSGRFEQPLDERGERVRGTGGNPFANAEALTPMADVELMALDPKKFK